MTKRGRPNKVPKDVLKKLIDRLYYEDLCENGKKLTAAEIARYCAANGYDIQPNSITRNKEIMAHINALKKKTEKPLHNGLPIVFRHTDVETVVNMSNVNLRRLLTERDSYYSDVCEAANSLLSENEKLKKKIEKLESKLLERAAEQGKIESAFADLKKDYESLKTECSSYKKIIKKYVKPDIATVLLKKENKKQSEVQTIIKEYEVEDSVITAKTKVKSGLIDELLTRYKE